MKHVCRTLLVILLATLFLGTCEPARAVDPSYEVTKSCRANIKLLRDALLEVLKKDPNIELPRDVAKFQMIYEMILTSKYLPKKPEPPTKDCEYYLLYRDPKNFDWFCEIHGVLPENGNETLTFPYHEYEFRAYFQKNYMNMSKYKAHYDRVMRWTSYSRTLSESVKYNYARNPVTTIVMCVLGLLVVWFLYRNLFD